MATVIPERRPEWLRVRPPRGENYENLKHLMRSKELHTVCEEARCPNIGECWGHKTATFMILGRVCTRSCGFCAVETGRPIGLDWEEPKRVAEAVQNMGLRHAVVTSVNRDELKDGGAAIFAATIRWIRRLNPDCKVEVLTPDFKGVYEALQIVIEVMHDIRDHYIDILTIGQYLRPSFQHLPIQRYIPLEEFAALKAEGKKMGFRHVESGPFVRSSYHAHEQADGAT